MKRIAVLILVFALLGASTAAALQVATVSCALPYTETTGTLGGADFIIRIPEPVTKWNGGLVVYCRGYSPTLPSINAVLSANSNMSRIPLGMGYAVAFSNYGEGGFCMQKAIIRTHQLTEWIVSNYGVTGKIYLIGVSMGGNMGLQLGAKYPDLYDGVIDLCAPKNMSYEYTDKMFLSSLSDSGLLTELANRGVTIFPMPNATVFKAVCLMMAKDIALECGGTPDFKPKAYERVSPIYNALDAVLPTITLQGNKDNLVFYTQSVAYKNAVATAGHSDMYRLYMVPNARHGDTALLSQLFQAPYNAFYQLVNWVEHGVPASPSS